MSSAKSKLNGQMFNLSQVVSCQKSSKNLHQADDLYFAQSETNIEKFLKNSYEKCFNLLDRIWGMGLDTLILGKKHCYQSKADIVEIIKNEFVEIENLQKFRMSKEFSKNNIPLVSSNKGQPKSPSSLLQDQFHHQNSQLRRLPRA